MTEPTGDSPNPTTNVDADSVALHTAAIPDEIPEPEGRTPEEEIKSRGFFANLRHLYRYAEGQTGRLKMGVVVILMLDIVDISWPFLIALAIDQIALATAGWDTPENASTRVATLCGIIVALFMLQGFLRFHMRMLFFGTSFRIARNLRHRLYEHLTQLERTYYTRVNTGELMSRLTNDIEAVQRFLGLGTLLFADTLFYFLLAPLPMLYFSWELTLICAIPMPFIPFIVRRMSTTVHQRYQHVQAQFATLADRSHESFAGIKVVKSFNREAHEQTTMERESDEFRRRFVHMARIDALFHPVFALIAGIEFFLILAIGGQYVLAGTLSIGAFAAFFVYVIKLTDPMVEVGFTISLYQRATASLARIRDIEETLPTIASPPDGGLKPEQTDFRAELEFRDLKFAYQTLPAVREDSEVWTSGGFALPPANHDDPAVQVLRGIDIHVPASGTVAIMGEVGSGKSTLLAMVPRIVDPPVGSVLLDGRPVQDYNLHWLRQQIGYVPQETFLFSQSIAENIALGVPCATRDDVLAAAKVARVDKDVAEFPDGYETMLGERGVNLSGGQKQRIAIARAVLRRPRLLLLDDCLSAVDAITEEHILRGLRELMQSSTTLIVSHRCSTVKDADRIIMLENGLIAEQGTHDELLAADGAYAQLWRRQQSEDDREAG